MLKVHKVVLENLRGGAKTSEVYEAARAFVAKERPDLVELMTKSVGFGIGLDFRDLLWTLDAKRQRKIRPGMFFNVAVGFSNIPLKGGKPYALLVVDTVQVQTSEAAVATTFSRSLDDVQV